MQLQALEGVADGCALRVQAKLARLAPCQRAALDEALSTLQQTVSEAGLAAAAAEDEGGAKGEAEAEGGPPTDRLAQHAVATAKSTAAAASGAARAMAAAAAAAYVRGVSPSPPSPVQTSSAPSSPTPTPTPTSALAGAPPPPTTDGGAMSERRGLASKGVTNLHALASQGLANVCALVVRALFAYASRCRTEADRPSHPEPGAQLAGELWVHGLDWPFVSELERARWKARCLRVACVRLAAELHSAANELSEAARMMQQALAHAHPPPQHPPPPQRPSTPQPAGPPPTTTASAELVALRQQVRALSTSIQLDVSAAVSMVHEAVQLCAPILCYVALADC